MTSIARSTLVALTAASLVGTVAASPAPAGSGAKTVTTRATPRLDAGKLQTRVKTIGAALNVNLSFRISARRATRGAATITPCYRRSGAIRCIRSRRENLESLRLRSGHTLVTRAERIAAPGFKITCARIEVRESRPGKDVPLLRKVSGRYAVDVCSR